MQLWAIWPVRENFFHFAKVSYFWGYYFFTSKTNKKFKDFCTVDWHKSEKMSILVLNYIFLYALSFYTSKIILDPPNCFGWEQIVLVGSKSFWSGPNLLVRFKLYFSGLIFIIWTCPKRLVLNQNDLDSPKSFWTHRRTKH